MYVLIDQRYPLNNISLLSRVRISDGSSKFRPESVNNAPPIVSIKEQAFSLESRDRECSLGCKQVRPLSEDKGIYSYGQVDSSIVAGSPRRLFNLPELSPQLIYVAWRGLRLTATISSCKLRRCIHPRRLSQYHRHRCLNCEWNVDLINMQDLWSDYRIGTVFT